jgi:exodeoxyribonuclease V alpha subunit
VTDPEVLTALALAVRAPRHGHVCVDLSTVDGSQLRPPESDGDAPELPANRSAWATAVAAAPLVRAGQDQARLPFRMDGSRLYTDRYWNYQQKVAERLHALAIRPLREPADPARLALALDRLFQPPSGAVETDLNRQRLAGATAALRDLTVITGGPGMGKTWTVRNILALALLDHPADAPPLRVALAAPSGKAAARMREALAEGLRTSLIPALSEVLGADQAQAIAGRIVRMEAVTLHRLLGWQPATPTRFRHHCGRPLVHDLVVVDECSMIDLAMMAKLLDAIGPSTRLVLLGDPHQLASVEAGTVLADICLQSASGPPVLSPPLRQALQEQLGLAHLEQLGTVPSTGLPDAIVRFDKNHRFADDSLIGRFAKACIGDVVDVPSTLALMQPGAELQRLDHSDGQLSREALRRIAEQHGPVLDAISAASSADPGPAEHRRILDAMAQHRVLCAHRRGRLGSVQVNQQLASLLGPEGIDPQRHWEGQPIIVRANDGAVGRANGDVGVIVRREGALVAAFPGPDALPASDSVHSPDHLRLVDYLSLARLPAHETCFAMTIHKSQGSQWPHITVVLPDYASPILTRELIYTAVTRAKRTATVLGAEAVLAHALERPVQRASGLSAALADQASQ